VKTAKQLAQLSLRDHAAGWVSFGQKWNTIFCRQNIGLSSAIVTYSKVVKFGEIKQNEGYYVVEGHSRSPMSVPVEKTYAISY